MATPTLAKSPSPQIPQEDSSRPYTGELVDELIDLVEQVEKKPVQSEGCEITSRTDEERKAQNEHMLIELWKLGDNFAMQYFCGPRVKAQTVIGRCEYEHPEDHWGEANGGFRCASRATVHDLASDLDLCLGHFRKVN